MYTFCASKKQEQSNRQSSDSLKSLKHPNQNKKRRLNLVYCKTLIRELGKHWKTRRWPRQDSIPCWCQLPNAEMTHSRIAITRYVFLTLAHPCFSLFSHLSNDITRPNYALDRSTILCLYVPGFQRQVLVYVPKCKWIPQTKFQWIPHTYTCNVNFVATSVFDVHQFLPVNEIWLSLSFLNGVFFLLFKPSEDYPSDCSWEESRDITHTKSSSWWYVENKPEPSSVQTEPKLANQRQNYQNRWNEYEEQSKEN